MKRTNKKLRNSFKSKSSSHGHRRTSNLGGAVNFCKLSARIFYYSFRKFAPVKRISAQLGRLQLPLPPRLLSLWFEPTVLQHLYARKLMIVRNRDDDIH